MISGPSSALVEPDLEFEDLPLRQARRRPDFVVRLGPKAFELSAGFLRIRDGDDPLDATAPRSDGALRPIRCRRQQPLRLKLPPKQRKSVERIMKDGKRPSENSPPPRQYGDFTRLNKAG
jgi:hypothetical protein